MHLVYFVKSFCILGVKKFAFHSFKTGNGLFNKNEILFLQLFCEMM